MVTIKSELLDILILAAVDYWTFAVDLYLPPLMVV